MANTTRDIVELDDAGRQLLALLIERLPTVKPGDPRTYISYKAVHDELRLPQLGPTYGESLKVQGLNSLASWTHETDLPGITGLIIDRVSMMPGDGYFKLFDRSPEDFAWWQSEIERSKVFDWSAYLTQNLEHAPNKNDGSAITHMAEEIDGEAWTVDELRSAIEAYLDMMDSERAGNSYVKKRYYEKLAVKFGRTAKAFEYRMQNISYVLALMGRDWLRGLKPAKNVGAKVAAQIEQLLAEAEGRQVVPLVAFEIAVRENVVKKQLPVPPGSSSPSQISSSSTQYVRDPTVKAWVLKQAGGICECCNQLAPFNGSDGMPYLEVHHVRKLADRGTDRVSNAVAVCPNCHRELHYGEQSKELVKRLYLTINRLVCE